MIEDYFHDLAARQDLDNKARATYAVAYALLRIARALEKSNEKLTELEGIRRNTNLSSTNGKLEDIADQLKGVVNAIERK